MKKIKPERKIKSGKVFSFTLTDHNGDIETWHVQTDRKRAQKLGSMIKNIESKIQEYHTAQKEFKIFYADKSELFDPADLVTTSLSRARKKLITSRNTLIFWASRWGGIKKTGDLGVIAALKEGKSNG